MVMPVMVFVMMFVAPMSVFIVMVMMFVMVMTITIGVVAFFLVMMVVVMFFAVEAELGFGL